MLRAGLGQGVEDRVAAADVGLHRVLRPDAVAQFQIVFVTRAAAVGVIRAIGQECAEDAVLHVEHRHVLMDRDLEPLRRRRLQERLELRVVQIVRRRHAFQAELLLEILRRQPIGDIERVIADAPVVGEEAQVVVIADQVTVCFTGTHLFKRPFLARLKDSWRRHEDFQRHARLRLPAAG